jgi:crossover junction endodeoxyribonuclease RusA
MGTTIVLEPPCDFLNANQRLHHFKRNDLTQTWRKAAAKALNELFEPYHYTRAHIVCTYRFPTNHRREVSNLQPTSKAIVDGLVDAQLIPDDDDTHVIGPDNRREYPNGPARVTVTITPLEQP